jgi:hypothetical protein
MTPRQLRHRQPPEGISTVLSDVGLIAENALHDPGVTRPAHAVTGAERRCHHRCDLCRRTRALLARFALLAAGETRAAGHQQTPAGIVATGHISLRVPIIVSFR